MLAYHTRLTTAKKSGASSTTSSGPSIASELAALFTNIASQKKRTGSLGPKAFLEQLYEDNELFRGNIQQDAHEFLNFLLNNVAETLQADAAAQAANPTPTTSGRSSRAASRAASRSGSPIPHKAVDATNTMASVVGLISGHAPDILASPGLRAGINGTSVTPNTKAGDIRTVIHDIFEGTLTNETKCLTCETVTSKDESFLDLSVDIDLNSSISACLRNFSSTELLNKQDKFNCDVCCTLQEAKKRLRVKRLPNVLLLHLKRFKYFEAAQRYRKLSHRVMFPFQLRLTNTSDEAENADRLYDLSAVVIHIGSGPNHGHYICFVKTHGHWMMFDDEAVEVIPESQIATVFGSTQETNALTETGYILFYQAADVSAAITTAQARPQSTTARSTAESAPPPTSTR